LAVEQRQLAKEFAGPQLADYDFLTKAALDQDLDAATFDNVHAIARVAFAADDIAAGTFHLLGTLGSTLHHCLRQASQDRRVAQQHE
jgi:hypothetical protein